MIKIGITVDWEGEHLHNIKDLLLIRKRIGIEKPFTHFICPTYFINTDIDETLEKIEEVIFDYDEIALHLHPLRLLIAQTNVKFREENNFFQPDSKFIRNIKRKFPVLYKIFGLNKEITGRGVPLSTYNKEEIYTIINTAREILEKNTGRKVKGFRSGGWLANDIVLEVLEALEFSYDSSAVPPEILSQGYTKENEGNKRDDYGDKNGIFTDYVLKMWGYERQENNFLSNIHRINSKIDCIKKETQPFYINNLFEIPNNCCLSDFASHSNTTKPVFEIAKQYIKEKKEDFYMITGCHQEGELDNKLSLLEFIQNINTEKQNEVEYIRLQDIIK